MDSIKSMNIAKIVLSDFEEQIKKYNLDLYDQAQVLRTAACVIEEQTFIKSKRKFNEGFANLYKRNRFR